MATAIKSTALDFQNIKNNLKSYLEQSEEFKDYDFEASGLSNILDVLAHNTHLNALTANFALNESFLGTAQLRSSIISLAEGLGYVPGSKKASTGYVRLSYNLSGLSDVPAKLQIPSGYKFTTTVGENNYTFQTQELIEAEDDGYGLFQFKTLDGFLDIPIYEGTARVKNFIAGEEGESTVYIIPDESIDLDTVVVRVYENATSDDFTTYQNLQDATLIDAETPAYILAEIPNGQYQLSFGNGITLGTTPEAGTKISVNYLSTVGGEADGARVFEPVSRVEVTNPDVGEGELRFPTVSTSTQSSGGAEKESIESIRRNAPFQYASQNRMVTHADYASLILRKYGLFLKDIMSWGGEDNIEPTFGTVFVSMVYKDGLSQTLKDSIEVGITNLAQDLAVASFDLQFADPITTYIETSIFFQFNPDFTSLSLNNIQENVKEVSRKYFEDNIGKFGQSFRRSNLLTLIDEVSPAILSSRMTVKMQQLITPSVGVEQDFTLSFPVPIAVSDDINYRVTSSPFFYDNKTCEIRNRLNSNTLEVVSIADNLVVVDNVGFYNAGTGYVNIVGLTIGGYQGVSRNLKISVTPANESAITPEREYILSYDNTRLTAKAIITSADN
jgi:hypothetical protein